MDQPRITSERIDDLPGLIYWLKRMQVDVIIDHVVGPPHGNWAGLSYGEVALVFVAYVVMCCIHFESNARMGEQTLGESEPGDGQTGA